MAKAFIIIFIYLLGAFLLFIAEDYKFSVSTLLLLITSAFGTYYLCRYFIEHKI